MSSNLYNKISLAIESQLPEFVREDYPLFIRFVEAYYEFLEQKLNDDPSAKNDLYTKARQLKSISDVDQSLDEFEDEFFNIFLQLFPRDTEASKELLIKNAIPFYKSKGNINSFKYFFRALFDEEIDLFAPRDNVLVASGGKWKILRTLRTTRQVYSEHTGGGTTFTLALRNLRYPQDPFVGQIYSIPGESYEWNGTNWEKIGSRVIDTVRVYVDDDLKSYITHFNFQREEKKIIFKTAVNANSVVKIFYDNFDHTQLRNRLITGQESRATSIIETSVAYVKNTIPIFEFEIDQNTIKGSYIGGEVLETTVLIDGVESLNLYMEPLSLLTAIEIQDGGSSYNVGDPILVSGGDPLRKANAQVSRVFSGLINNININYGGAGFKVGFPINVTNTGIYTVSAVSSAIDTSGANSANSYVYVTNMIRDLSANNINSANYRANNCFLGSNITSPNANSRLIDVFSYSTLTQIGPITEALISSSNSPANVNPIVDAASSNVPITSFGGVVSTFAAVRDIGSLGRIDVQSGGSGYKVGDKIRFDNILGSGYGVGARAAVTEIDSSGGIVKTEFQPYPPFAWGPEYIAGKSNVTAGSVTITGASGSGTNYTANIFPSDVIKIENGWRLENASYSGKYIDASQLRSDYLYIIRGLATSNDNSKMYVLQDGAGAGANERIYQFNIRNPLEITDISPSTVANANLNSLIATLSASGLVFKDDGTRLYTTHFGSAANNRVYELWLSTPWDISTITAPTAANVNVTAQESSVRGVEIANNGYSMYIGGNNSDRVNQYYLSTPWQVNTASFVRSFNPPEMTDARKVQFHPLGNVMYLMSATGNIVKYNLSEAWNVQTAVSDGIVINPRELIYGSLIGSFLEFKIVSNGTILLVSDSSGSEATPNSIHSISIEEPLYRQVVNVGSTTSFNVNTAIPTITSPSPTSFSVVRLERNSLDVSIESGNNYITGNRTFFTRDFRPGANVTVFNQVRTIDKIISNTSMNTTVNFSVSKQNTEIGLFNLYPIGGQGYSQTILPEAVVENSDGVGARLITTSIMGDGENIIVNSNRRPGEILDVEITDPGSSYKFAPVLSLSDYGDGTANLTPVLESSFFEYPGLYLGTDGHISSDKKIQDSILYNTGAYLIKTRQQFTKFKTALLNLLHPSGSYTYVEYTPTEPIIALRESGMNVTSNLEITTS